MSKEKMTKSEFLKYVAKQYDLDYKTVVTVCDAIIAGAKDMLKEGKTLSFPTFGQFFVKMHKGQTAYIKGKKVLPDYKCIKFAPSKCLTDLIRKN